jgi:hypothetical protein
VAPSVGAAVGNRLGWLCFMARIFQPYRLDHQAGMSPINSTYLYYAGRMRLLSGTTGFNYETMAISDNLGCRTLSRLLTHPAEIPGSRASGRHHDLGGPVRPSHADRDPGDRAQA